MTALMIAFALSFGLAMMRLAANHFEAMYFLVRNREWRNAFGRLRHAMVCVGILAAMIRPIVLYADRFEVRSFDTDNGIPSRIIDDAPFNAVV